MSPTKFKEGDVVQISDESLYKSQGYEYGEKMRGVIVDRSGSEGWWRVEWLNGGNNTYRDIDLEPYEGTMSHGFYIGERVTGSKSGRGLNSSDIDKEFFIVEFGLYGGDPGVKLSDAVTGKIYKNRFFYDFVDITSIKKIETTSTPKPEENVTFTVNGKTFDYSLCSTYYSNGRNNDAIFDELEVDKHNFCSEAYGYEAFSGGWPEWRAGDNEAPVKIVKAIREKIKEIESMQKSEPIDKEAILKEARRRYPIGTKYRPIGSDGIEFDSDSDIIKEATYECRWVETGLGIDCGLGYVYANGKWAKIVSAPAGMYGTMQTDGMVILDPTPISPVKVSIPIINDTHMLWAPSSVGSSAFDSATKQLPDTQSPIIMSRSKNKNKIKVL